MSTHNICNGAKITKYLGNFSFIWRVFLDFSRIDSIRMISAAPLMKIPGTGLKISSADFCVLVFYF